MVKDKAPCKDCDRREIGCHSTCIDYISYRKIHEKNLRKKAVAKYKMSIGYDERCHKREF